jgi:hypothetical protein
MNRRVDPWRTLLWCWLAGGGLLSAGCGQKVWITQYPAFYKEEYRDLTIAVVPFRSPGNAPQAGEVLAEELGNLLKTSGSYKEVFNLTDLKTLVDIDDLKRAADSGSDAALAQALQPVSRCRAILTGGVGTCAATSNTTIMRLPIYSYRRDGTMYVSGYNEIPVVRNEANVAATARLIRLPAGTVIHVTPGSVQGRAFAEGSYRAKRDVNACLALATTDAATQLLEQFAVIRKQITLKPEEALRTACDFYDNNWTFRDDFKAGEEKMFVVVNLPASCDRNRFRIAIVRKDQRQDLASEEIVWTPEHVSASGKTAGKGYPFSPRDIAAKGGGPGEYQVKFYSGPEPIIVRTLRIY